MNKKRRTRQEKIIANLKRQLQQKQAKISPKVEKVLTSNQLHKDKETAVFTNVQVQEKNQNKEEAFFSYPPHLIKKSLLKTLVLSLVFEGSLVLIYYLTQIKHLLPF